MSEFQYACLTEVALVLKCDIMCKKTHVIDFTGDRKNGTALSVAIFRTGTNTVQIPDTDFHPNPTVTVPNADKIFFKSLKKGMASTMPIFIKLV
jgi:hypothetical protein